MDMFTACTERDVKQHILAAFCTPDSHLRVVLATIAFGMGLDCPSVRRVIHWCPSGDMELYLQETGRAGQDMLPAQAILYVGGEGLVIRDVDEKMEYCAKKDSCQREMLLKHFDSSSIPRNVNKCLCCDVCERKCFCPLCS